MPNNLGEALIRIVIDVVGTQRSQQQIQKAFDGIRTAVSGLNLGLKTAEGNLKSLNNSLGETGTKAKKFATDVKQSAESLRSIEGRTEKYGSALKETCDKLEATTAKERAHQAAVQRGVNIATAAGAAQERYKNQVRDLDAALEQGEISNKQYAISLQRIKTAADAATAAERNRRANARGPALNTRLPVQGQRGFGGLDQNIIRQAQQIQESISRGRALLTTARQASFNELRSQFDDLNEAARVDSRLTEQVVRRKNQLALAYRQIPLRTFSDNLRQQSQQLRNVGFAFSDAGRQAVFFGAAIGTAIAGITIQFAKFEQEVQNTIAVLGNLGAEAQRLAFDQLSEQFLSIGERTEFTATQVAEAARQLGLAGFNLREVADSIEDVVNLASAGNVALETASRIAVNLTRAFNVDTTNIERISDVLVAVATNSNTTVETLGESFKLLAPIAANLGQPLEEVTAALGILGNAGITACYDDQTEVLTDTGWHLWKDLSKDFNGKFATVNKDNRAIEWHSPIRMYEYTHSGDMYKVANHSLDFMVTPNHKLYAKPGRTSSNNNYSLLEASELVTSEYRVLATGENVEKDRTYFTLNGWTNRNKGFYVDDVDDTTVEMDAWLKFLGAYFAEGWCDSNVTRGNYRIQIAQQRKSKGFEPYTEAFAELPFRISYSEKQGKFKSHNQQLWKYLSQFGKRAYNKRLPKFLFKLSRRQIRLFLEYYRLGDGTKKSDSDGFVIYTSSKQLRDDLHRLGTLAGYRCISKLRNEDSPNPVINGRKVVVKHDQYYVSFNSRTLTPTVVPSEFRRAAKRAEERGETSEFYNGYIHYDGQVYCAEVPNNTLIVRRNGKSHVSGNSRAGTGLSRAFSELLEKSEDFDLVLRSVGSSFERIDPTRVGLTDIIAEFERLRGVAGLSTVNFFDLFDQRSARVITTLINQGSTALEELADKAENSATVALRIREQRLDTLEGDFRRATSAINSAFIRLGQTVAPIIRDLLVEVTELVRGFTSFVEANPQLISGVLRLAAGLAALSVTLGGIGLAFGTAARGAAALGLAISGAINFGQFIQRLLSSTSALVALNGATVTYTASTTNATLATRLWAGALRLLAGAARIASAALALLAANPVVAAVAGITLLVGGAIALSQAFGEVNTEGEEALQSLENGADAANERIADLLNNTRELRNQFDLIRNLPNLNQLQLTQLFGGEDEVGFAVERFDEEIANLRNEADRLNAEIDDTIKSIFPDDTLPSLTLNLRDSDGVIREIETSTRKVLGLVEETTTGALLLKVAYTDAAGEIVEAYENISFDGLDNRLKEQILRSKAVQTELEEIGEIRTRGLALLEVFSQGLVAVETELIRKQEERIALQEEVKQAELDLKRLRDEGVDQESSLFKEREKRLLSLQDEQAINQAIIKDLSSARNSTDEQLKLRLELVKVNQRLFELAGSQIDATEAQKAEVILLQTERERLIELARREKETVDELEKAQQESAKRAQERAREVERIQQANEEFGKTREQIELERLREFQEEARKARETDQDDTTFTEFETNILRIEEAQGKIKAIREVLGNIANDETISATRRRELTAEVQNQENIISNLKKEQEEIVNRSKEAELAATERLRQLNQASAEEAAEAADDRINTLRELELQQAERAGNIERQIELTRLLAEEEAQLAADKEIATREEAANNAELAAQRQRFIALKREETEADIQDIRDKAEEEQKRQEKEENKERERRLKDARKEVEAGLKKQESIQDKIRDALFGQAKSYADIIRANIFLARVELGREARAERARKAALVAARRLAAAQREGARQVELDRLQSELAAREAFARRAGVDPNALPSNINQNRAAEQPDRPNQIAKSIAGLVRIFQTKQFSDLASATYVLKMDELIAAVKDLCECKEKRPLDETLGQQLLGNVRFDFTDTAQTITNGLSAIVTAINDSAEKICDCIKEIPKEFSGTINGNIRILGDQLTRNQRRQQQRQIRRTPPATPPATPPTRPPATPPTRPPATPPATPPTTPPATPPTTPPTASTATTLLDALAGIPVAAAKLENFFSFDLPQSLESFLSTFSPEQLNQFDIRSSFDKITEENERIRAENNAESRRQAEENSRKRIEERKAREEALRKEIEELGKNFATGRVIPNTLDPDPAGIVRQREARFQRELLRLDNQRAAERAITTFPSLTSPDNLRPFIPKQIADIVNTFAEAFNAREVSDIPKSIERVLESLRLTITAASPAANVINQAEVVPSPNITSPNVPAGSTITGSPPIRQEDMNVTQNTTVNVGDIIINADGADANEIGEIVQLKIKDIFRRAI
jgi:hypothetical protein